MILYYKMKFYFFEYLGIFFLKRNNTELACILAGHATAAGVRAGILVPNPRRRELNQPLLVFKKDL